MKWLEWLEELNKQMELIKGKELIKQMNAINVSQALRRSSMLCW